VLVEETFKEGIRVVAGNIYFDKGTGRAYHGSAAVELAQSRWEEKWCGGERCCRLSVCGVVCLRSD
jgi:hypothetical protein